MRIGPSSTTSSSGLILHTAHRHPTEGYVSADLERAFELFPRLRERRAQLAGTLSCGEQQMLAMARALMLQPEALLLDEPSMGLAPQLVDGIFATITRLKDMRITLLLAEQFAAAALEIADFGYVTENGCIRTSGEASLCATILK